MNIHEIQSQLQQLKLKGMLQAYEEQQGQPVSGDLSFNERFSWLINREQEHRQAQRLARLLRSAKLRVQASVEQIDYQHPRGLTRDQMVPLIQGVWLTHHRNVLITGPTGIGKSWIACALGLQACRQGIRVAYYRLPRLLEKLRLAKAEGTYAQVLQSLSKVGLLILDDWGLDPLKSGQRQDLLEVIEDRHELSSTLITSQLPVDQWHDFIGEATLADAILDRLIHGSYRLTLRGESMRRRQGLEIDQKTTTRKNAKNTKNDQKAATEDEQKKDKEEK